MRGRSGRIVVLHVRSHVREPKDASEGMQDVAGGRCVMDIRSSSACYSATDPWHDLGCDQLNLAALVTYWPEVDSLAACAGIAGQQLRALVHRADADPAAKLRRVLFDQRTYNLGQDPFRI